MARSAAKTPAEYLASLPADWRAAIAAVRDVVNQYIQRPSGSNELLKQAFAKAGKKFDMGKSCLHFTRPEDLELGAIGDVIASYSPDQWIAVMERSRRKPLD